MKTRKSAAKRFRVTPTGKVMFLPAGLRHNLENMSGAQRRQKRGLRTLPEEHAATVLRLLGRR
ncbi:MAG TPA: 50S ribosomal protein L35 [Miltoncostaeaceae bacterium]|nr:50S ribosomal protein L35 [Miltoncostaeaceae bacterium]